jgi:hypothetical protein
MATGFRMADWPVIIVPMPALGRKITVVVPEADCAALDAGIVQHGGVTAAVCEGLRRDHAARNGSLALQPAAPAPSTSTSPVADWAPVSQFTDVFNLPPSTVEEWGREGRVQLRGRGRSRELDLASLWLDRAGAAGVLGIDEDELERLTAEGRQRVDERGLYSFTELGKGDTIAPVGVRP